MNKVLIVGAHGFVGSHLFWRLIETPSVDCIVTFDKAHKGYPTGSRYFTDPRRQNVSHLDVQGDVHNLEQLTHWMKGCDTVFHLAANADIAKAATDPSVDFTEGTMLTHNVLEAMRANEVKRLIYFSGSGVYGDNPFHAWEEDDGPLYPISPYGASKLASEAMICAYCHMLGMTARAFRFANLVGAGQTHGVGYDFLRKLKPNPYKLEILGDGTQSKSYLHINDALDAVLHINAQAESGYDVFNVATEDSLTVKDIAKMAAVTMGLIAGNWGNENFTIVTQPSPRGWKGDVPIIRMNCAKIHALGWRPKLNSSQAMLAALTDMKKEL